MPAVGVVMAAAMAAMLSRCLQCPGQGSQDHREPVALVRASPAGHQAVGLTVGLSSSCSSVWSALLSALWATSQATEAKIQVPLWSSVGFRP